MGDNEEDMFDATKDYYAILGVAKDASLEEIKKAHVKLALENHPDMLALEDRDNSLVNDGGERFRRISEAWNVLSKPSAKKAYDAVRMGPAAARGRTVNTNIDESYFTTQKAHYNNAVKAAAMSNWREVQDKYQTAKWRKMTLDEKKLSRASKIHSTGGSLFGIMATGLLFFGVAGGIVTAMTPKKAVRR